MIWTGHTCFGASHLKGSKASSVTIHGDIVVPKADIIEKQGKVPKIVYRVENSNRNNANYIL